MLGFKGAPDDTVLFHYDMVICVQNTRKRNSKTRIHNDMVIFVLKYSQRKSKNSPVAREGFPINVFLTYSFIQFNAVLCKTPPFQADNVPYKMSMSTRKPDFPNAYPPTWCLATYGLRQDTSGSVGTNVVDCLGKCRS